MRSPASLGESLERVIGLNQGSSRARRNIAPLGVPERILLITNGTMTWRVPLVMAELCAKVAAQRSVDAIAR